MSLNGLLSEAWSLNRSTVYRWVRRFLPLFGTAARAHRRQVGEKWRVDETYCRLNGKWTYIYRAIDQDGQVVDAYFSKRRNADAAEGFFRRSIDETGVKPERVTTDKAKCYPPALRNVLPGVEHQTSKYLNNGIERDHGHLKQRLYPMRGFKQEASADVIVRGHALDPESAQRLLRTHGSGSAQSPACRRLATVGTGHLTPAQR